MAVAIPLKVSLGTTQQLASIDTLAVDGLEPRSGSALTLGNATTTVVSVGGVAVTTLNLVAAASATLNVGVGATSGIINLGGVGTQVNIPGNLTVSTQGNFAGNVQLGDGTGDAITIADHVEATGTFTSTGAFSDGETVTIGSQTYTFRSPFVDAANNINAAGTTAATHENLRRAINGSGVAGTNYGTGTVTNTFVTAGTETATTNPVTAKNPHFGMAGNSIATTDTAANASWGGATLAGGTSDTTTLQSSLVIEGTGAFNLGSVTGYLGELWLKEVSGSGGNAAVNLQATTGAAAGAYAIGTQGGFTNFTAADTSVAGALSGIDTAIGTANAKTLEGVINAAAPDNDVNIPTAAPIIWRDGGAAVADVLSLRRTFAGAGEALDVQMAAGTTGRGIEVTAVGTGAAVYVDNTGTGNSLQVRAGGANIGVISSTGGVALTATAASSFTSTAALTLTAGAASSWGTSAGNLVIASAASATVDGATGLQLQSAGTTKININTAGEVAVTPTAGENFSVTATGAGIISLVSAAAITVTAGASSVWSTTAGSLQVRGFSATTIGLVATTTQLNGNPVIGATSADDWSINARLTSDIVGKKELARAIYIDQSTVATAGAAIEIKAGKAKATSIGAGGTTTVGWDYLEVTGGNSLSPAAAGAGSGTIVTSGGGGNGDLAVVGAKGGSTEVRAGRGGASGTTAVSGNGGDTLVSAGPKGLNTGGGGFGTDGNVIITAGGTTGIIQIGSGSTSEVQIGSASVPTKIYGPAAAIIMEVSTAGAITNSPTAAQHFTKTLLTTSKEVSSLVDGTVEINKTGTTNDLLNVMKSGTTIMKVAGATALIDYGTYVETARTVSGGTGDGASFSLKQGAATIKIAAGTASPAATGPLDAGIAYGEGSLYARTTPLAGELWLKTGAAATAWTQVTTGGSDTLQQAYVAGNTIVATDAEGSIAFSIAGTDVGDLLTLTRTNTGAGEGLAVSMGAVTTGHGAEITMVAGSTGAGIAIPNAATSATSHGISVAMTGAMNAGASGIRSVVSNASAAGTAVTATHAGTGSAVSISHTGTGATAYGLEVSKTGVLGHGVSVAMGASTTNSGVSITQNGVATASHALKLSKLGALGNGIRLDMSSSTTEEGIALVQAGTAAQSHGLSVGMGGGAAAAGSGIFVQYSNAASTGTAVEITQAGTGDALNVYATLSGEINLTTTTGTLTAGSLEVGAGTAGAVTLESRATAASGTAGLVTVRSQATTGVTGGITVNSNVTTGIAGAVTVESKATGALGTGGLVTLNSEATTGGSAGIAINSTTTASLSGDIHLAATAGAGGTAGNVILRSRATGGGTQGGILIHAGTTLAAPAAGVLGLDAAVSMTASAPAMNIVATAGGDINFTARSGAAIPFSATAPDNALNPGFTATSIVGAINELYTGTGSASQIVQTGFTTSTAANIVSSGLLGYLTTTANEVFRAVATSVAVACATIGVNEGTSGSMTTHGTIESMKAEPDITIVAGDCLFLSVATGNSNGTGSVTDVAPTTVGQVVLRVGTARTTMTGNHTGTGDSFAFSSPTVTLTDAAATFVAGDVGRVIRISGATTPANNGYFIVASFIDTSNITFRNSAGVAEAFGGTWSIGGSFAMVLKIGELTLL